MKKCEYEVTVDRWVRVRELWCVVAPVDVTDQDLLDEIEDVRMDIVHEGTYLIEEHEVESQSEAEFISREVTGEAPNA